MNEDQVQTAVIEWLSNLTGLTVIRTNQGGDRPEKPYITANLIFDEDVRQWCSDEFSEEVADGEGGFDTKISTGFETQWQFSLQCYGENSMNHLSRVRRHYRTNGAFSGLEPDLIIHDVGPVNRIPEQVKHKWEERSQCNFFVRGLVYDENLTDTIEEGSVEIQQN